MAEHPATKSNASLGQQLAVPLLAAALFAVPWTWLRHWEADTQDFRLRLRGGRTDAPVVLVTVEDSSFTVAERAPQEAAREPLLAAMGRPWPWDRRIFAGVVEKLAAAGARAVVFDIVFAAETPGDGDFAATLAACPVPVVLSRHYVVSETPEGERSVTLLEPRPEFTRAAPVRTGFANIWPDDDGVLRRVRTQLAPGELLGDAGGPADEDSLGLAAARAVGATAPGPRTGIVDFLGPEGVVVRVPVEHLFLPDRWQGGVIRGGELFRDRIVVVGPGSELRFKDYHATPFGRMSGPELQANITAALAGRGLLREPPAWAGRLAVLAAALLGGLVVARGADARRQALGLAALLALWLAGAHGALLWSGSLVPVAAPAGALLTAGLGGIVRRYASEQRERRKLRALLSSYVSEQVAEVIVRQPEALRAAMQGERRPVTVLFADLRGFTALSEERDPAALVAQLNEHLRAMVDCVLAEGGTVQKFIGDAILAVWGDTHSAGEAADAERAVAAALAMEASLARLNAAWAGRADRVPLRLGLGLQHGLVTVGNLGHPRRMEFGVLGDAVNTASRLEGATKHLGVPVLAGEPVARLAGGRFRFVPVARLQLAGRTAPIEVFTPVGPAGEPEQSWQLRYQNALARLQAGDFVTAEAGFAALAADDASASALLAFQVRRARQLAAQPPADWDGVLRLDEK